MSFPDIYIFVLVRASLLNLVECIKYIHMSFITSTGAELGGVYMTHTYLFPIFIIIFLGKSIVINFN